MSEPIVIALIGLAGSVIGSIIGILASTKLIQYRIEQLEKKVEKHNSVIERTFKLESHEKLFDLELKEIEQKIDRLENYHR